MSEEAPEVIVAPSEVVEAVKRLHALRALGLGILGLQDIPPAPASPVAPESPHYNIDQAAAYLQKSRQTIKNLRAQGKLTPLPNSGRIPLFTKEELDRFLSYQKPRPGRKPKI